MVYFADVPYKIKIPPPKDPNRRQMVLEKGRIFDGQGWMSQEIYIFRYDAGKEVQLLESLIESVKDTRTNFEWYDANVISDKVRPGLFNQADKLLKS